MPCPQYVLTGVEVFLNLGPALLKCYGPGATLMRY